jgi:hypothetical protein
MKNNSKKVRFILPLVALCLPLFVEYGVSADNSCPYQTYIYLEGKCVDLSTERLNTTSNEPNKAIEKVDREVRQLNQELTELCSEELTSREPTEEIVEEMCQG